jgi:1-acyl-sn-glycerol-3-phosphate acyltransferase
MENPMSIRKQAGVMLAALLFAGTALAQAPDVKPERIRGDIVSFQGDILTVHRKSGDTVSIELKPDVGVSALKAISLSDVKAGSYVGAAAIANADGKMTAVSLLVFPDGARGTKEGHFPYDFGARSTMTNANVDNTVVTANNGRELKLSYKGGTKVVTVPEKAPVVTFAPATRADLIAGKKVFVLTTPTKAGVYEAHVLLVEKDGVVPPI